MVCSGGDFVLGLFEAHESGGQGVESRIAAAAAGLYNVVDGLFESILGGLHSKELGGIIKPCQEGAGPDRLAFKAVLFSGDVLDGARCTEFKLYLVGHIEVTVRRDGQDKITPDTEAI